MNVTHRPETRLTATLESLNVLPTEDSHMNSFLRLILAASAVATIALGADNTIGTWKYNTAKSKGAPGVPPVTNLTVTREATEGGVKITAKVKGPMGRKSMPLQMLSTTASPLVRKVQAKHGIPLP